MAATKWASVNITTTFDLAASWATAKKGPNKQAIPVNKMLL